VDAVAYKDKDAVGAVTTMAVAVAVAVVVRVAMVVPPMRIRLPMPVPLFVAVGGSLHMRWFVVVRPAMLLRAAAKTAGAAPAPAMHWAAIVPLLVVVRIAVLVYMGMPADVPGKRDRRMPRHRTDHPQGLALTSPN
jgi:hypothetical protein